MNRALKVNSYINSIVVKTDKETYANHNTVKEHQKIRTIASAGKVSDLL